MTHTDDKTARERAHVEAIMEKLRSRGILTSPAPLPGEPFTSTLVQLERGGWPRQTYPTAQQYDIWAANPQAMSPEQHSAFCDAGLIVHAGDTEPHKCPRCAVAAEEANLRQRLVNAGVDGRYLDSRWADLEQPAPLDRLAAACNRVSEIITAGQSLLLWSRETGSGKTQAAMLTAAAAVRLGHTAHVTNLARLAVEIRDGYGDKSGSALKEGAALARLCAPKLLVIDDLGAGESDSAAIERRLLFLALDHRQMHRLPTVVTTNVSPKELAELLGARVIARLQPLTIIHVNHGINFRARNSEPGLW